MENPSTQADNNLPFALYEEEEVKLTQNNINLTVKYNKSDEYELKNGTLLLTTQRVVYYVESEKKLVYFNYQNAVSFGLSKNSLIVFMSDLQDDMGQNDEEEDDMDEEEQDDIIEKLKRVSDFEEESHVNLVGNYEVTFDFVNTGITNLDNILEMFNFCSNLNPDEGGEEMMCGEDFITADDIDDNGNVIFNRNMLVNANRDAIDLDGDEDEEGEDDGEEENGDSHENGAQNGTQQPPSEDKMQEESKNQ